MECTAVTTIVCRGCLATDRPMRNMFELFLHDHYATFTKVQVKRSEGLSEMLCDGCERALLDCRRFRSRCQQSDVVLRSASAPKRLPHANAEPTGLEKSVKESTVNFVLTEERLILLITPGDLESNAEGNLICPYNCKFVFTRQNHLLKHLMKRHGVDETKFVIESQFYCPHSSCDYCIDSGKNKYFSVRKTLKNHIANIHRTKDFVCESCNELFALQSALNRHRAVCSQRFVCAVCSLEYKTNERLLVHLMRKHPDLHREYKKERKEMKERSKLSAKRIMEDENMNAKRIKLEPIIESRSTQTGRDKEMNTKRPAKVSSDYMFDCSPKRTFATQTFEMKAVECVKNDISLSSCVAHSPMSLKDSVPLQNDKINYELQDVFSLNEERIHSSTIETQTVFEDLLSIRSQNSEDEIFETVSLSDIQTQTWPLEFGISSPLKKKNTSETQTNPFLTKLDTSDLSRGLTSSPDLSFKETQTCFCLHDSPKPSTSHFNFPKVIFESSTSSPINCMTSTETQTADSDGLSRRKDVLLSFQSIETQTCEESRQDNERSLTI